MTIDQPTVSVIMTTYNGSRLISASIESVLSQTWRDYELIVVDDCSTDDTVARIEKYTDPRIRIFRNSPNLGVVGSRNIGYALARGRYLAMLDHDDLSLPERLERQVSYLDKHSNVVLVSSRWLDLNSGATIPDPHTATEPLLVRWALHLSNPLSYSSIMVRKECVQRLTPPMRQERVLADDFDFYHRLLTMGEVARLPETLTIYRVHASNTSRHRTQEMQNNAALVLADAYASWFGSRAGEAAELMIRLVASRAVARDDAELCRFREILEVLAQSFIEQYSPTAADVLVIKKSVRDVFNVALRRRLKAGGLSSLLHLAHIVKEDGQWAGLLGSLMIGMVPRKDLIRKFAKWRLGAENSGRHDS